MVGHLFSKIAVTIYILIAIGLGFWGFTVFKQRDGKVPASTPQSFSNDSSSSTASTDELTNDKDADNQTSSDLTPSDNTTSNSLDANSSSPTSTPVDKNAPAVSPEVKISGSVLAHITPQHCNDNCQAFSIDLKLFEYCEQACGISPIKNVSNCDDKKGIQKDYCLKDLAINKKDVSQCDKVSDANIKQSCKNRIAQDAIENL